MSLAEVSDSIPSLASELRSRSDEALLELFNARPDLVTPVPSDIASLAARATSTPSLLRAIETLNHWQYQVLIATAVADEPFTYSDIATLTHPTSKKVLDHLYSLALIYKEGSGFRVPRSLRELIGDQPAGLGPRSASSFDLKVLKKAPSGAKELLDRLTWGPARGNIGDAKAKGGPIEWLLENKLLILIDSKTVALPLEVGLALRGGKVHRELQESQPTLETIKVKPDAVERASLASISTVLRWVEELANFWSEETPNVIQSGGLGVRDLRKIAEHLDVEEACAAFVAELAFITGLIAIDGGSVLPTLNFDLWLNKSAEERWRDLAASWRTTSRVAGLIGRSESRNLTALGNELDRANASLIREHVLDLLVQGESNNTPTLDSIVKAVLWRYPHKRGVSITTQLVEWTLRESEWLGITGAGALSRFGALFLEEAKSLKIDASMPKPVDHILIQSDNTAIAPGPLTSTIAEQLSTFADIESRGGATVYRFNESSIRRGLDHGHSGEEIRSFLSKTSKTPIPQPLEYLISDVARKHGQLRIGTSHSYLRCEDSALLAAILNDKKLEALGLRQIAPQVLISIIESATLLEELRYAGYFPAGESSRGALMTPPPRKRAKTKPRPPRILHEISKPSQEILDAALRVLRSGERTSIRRSTREIPRTSAEQTLELLKEYVGKGVALQIGYADYNGAVALKIIDPISLSVGTLIARDHTTNGISPFKLARITGVATA